MLLERTRYLIYVSIDLGICADNSVVKYIYPEKICDFKETQAKHSLNIHVLVGKIPSLVLCYLSRLRFSCLAERGLQNKLIIGGMSVT